LWPLTKKKCAPNMYGSKNVVWCIDPYIFGDTKMLCVVIVLKPKIKPLRLQMSTWVPPYPANPSLGPHQAKFASSIPGDPTLQRTLGSSWCQTQHNLWRIDFLCRTNVMKLGVNGVSETWQGTVQSTVW
jgi:hypothetical protein